ncbi:MAG TPA: AtpZ/AtpI family protein [Tepiditoga sp.]|nr:AtpZ/AtpI family protein [Tepiditoga sp.]
MKKLDLKTLGYANLIYYFAIVVITNIAVGFGIGYLIYRYFSSVLWLIIFVLLGVISGLYNGIKEIRKEADKLDRIKAGSQKTNNNNTSDNNS